MGVTGDRIYDNESWNPDCEPLSLPRRKRASATHPAINGIELNGARQYYTLLDGTANRQTSLTIKQQASLEGAPYVTVVPVATRRFAHARVG